MREKAILCVEDNDDDFEAIKLAFTSHSTITNPIIRAKDVHQALSKLYERPPFTLTSSHPPLALIILDLNIPGINGGSLLQSIRANELYASLPIIIYTGLASTDDKAHCIKHGADDFISKYDNIQNLLDCVELYVTANVGETGKR